MKKPLHNIRGYVSSLLTKSSHQLDHWFTQETHKIAITGLSRSGKSMLFTSLITTLKHRCEDHYHCLPLLKSLPSHLVESVRLEDVKGHQPFPIRSHIQSLEKQEWPAATEQIYAFKLIVKLKQTGTLKKYLLPYSEVIFEFFDYPGEWITDLPMLNQTFAQWSDSAWAQQVTEPQRYYAQEWHEFIQHFNFEVTPNVQNRAKIVQAYRAYLHASKAGGISLLQPGSFLISGSGFNWQTHGFTPLPSKV
ncbi:MAG: YcjX family protein, partial [Thiomicrorhabdus sp.]|nr:YcjX family protein [Thiomicrorhabdus sp.]